MKHKFKVGDKVQMTLDSHRKGLNEEVGLSQIMMVKELLHHVVQPMYRLMDVDGDSTGLWFEGEIEPFKPTEAISLTKWALVHKNAPKVLDQEMFRTRQEARRAKRLEYNGATLKVVKVMITYEV